MLSTHSILSSLRSVIILRFLQVGLILLSQATICVPATAQAASVSETTANPLTTVAPMTTDESEAAAADVLEFPAAELAFFENKVRPLLAEHCFECHSGEKRKGQLQVDSREALLIGGESGAAIDPGHAAESLLIQAVRYESYEMPPSGKLSQESIEILEQWVARGAAWPGATTHPVKARAAERGFNEEDRSWWAIQPVQDSAPPQLENDTWSRNGIDRFLLSQMTSAGLVPAPEADRETLIRRLSFDLIGLPPTPEAVAAFVNDESPDAYNRLVDEFLESPRYGERAARQWLDVVRYADSDGYRIDHYRPNSWRYRDYVISSFNNDKPYDRFVQEQLAGDELFPDNPDAMIATGFLRHWIYEYNNRDVRGQWDLILNEVTDTTSDVFLGVGLQCARCHDHKYDPLLQKDYYRLRAFFEAIRPIDQHVVASSAEQQSYREQLQAWEAATTETRAKIDELLMPYQRKATQDAIEKFPADIQALLTADRSARNPLEQQLFELAWRQVDYEFDRLDDTIKGDNKEKLLALRRELASHESNKPSALPVALIVTDTGTIAPATTIPKRKIEVGPGFLSILDSEEARPESLGPFQLTTGRRAALAKWVTQADNPLSTRVIVNRIWQSHFGRGLAQNSSDLGTLGGPPTHPKLLDWLTARFVQNGWKIKDLHRLIVTSAAYRMSSAHPRMAEFQLTDPQNRHYWRFNVRRLDAEQIRDAILSVSGQLDNSIGGPGVQSDVPRRSIYLRVMRNERDALLDVFDLPLFFSSTSSRDTTTSPVQSLLLFNSQIMMNHAQQLADAMMSPTADSADGENQIVQQLWQRAFGRDPSSTEVASAKQFLLDQRHRIEQVRGASETSAVPIGRLPYRDGQAILVSADEKPLRMSRESTETLNPVEFTFEACVQIRSIFDTGAVRTIAGKWNGDAKSSGWSFGVTGKGSRRKPQTLVIQLYGKHADGTIREAAVFSDQHLELNIPYYVGVSVKLATVDGEKGAVTFHVKNLANDDEPLNTVTVPHEIVEPISNTTPLTLGFRGTAKNTSFDGLIDDVRFSSSILPASQLLISAEQAGPTTVAFWRFEPQPGLLEDSANDLKLSLTESDKATVSVRQAALRDLCHVILNSSEFLYVK